MTALETQALSNCLLALTHASIALDAFRDNQHDRQILAWEDEINRLREEIHARVDK